jgi:protein-arginine kinase activator protein McsA
MDDKIRDDHIPFFLKWIKDELKKAIYNENYEEAAKLRDTIKKYKPLN